MVSSIKGGSTPQQSASSPTQQKQQPAKQGGSAELRSSFRSLSSGLAVQTSVASEAKASGKSRESKDLSNVLNGLNDAISFSAKALDALGKIEGEAAELEEAGGQDLNQEVVQLREDIGRTLQRLQSGADTAEVIRENMMSSSARPEDVDAAISLARETGSAIQNSDEAVRAHSGLDPLRVAQLLAEK
ncbi:MAG: hypothetical protein KDD66_08045 [Bdellovibrionales bacterium]|nr:hypothetical protein [Bdellovibrionales bacterium]